MKSKHYLLILFCATTVLTKADSWTQKADVGTLLRADGIGCSVGNKGYIGTGYVAGYTTDWYEYTPATNTWLQKANYAGVGIVEASVFTIDSLCYVVPAPSGNDFWQYDPTLNLWTQKATFAGGARQAAIAWTINNKGYICSGATPSLGGSSGDLWEYDPATNAWQQKTTLTGPARHYAVGFAIGSKGYIGTGVTAGQTYSNDFWEWDSATDTWSQKANLVGAGRFEATAFTLGNFGYVTGGYASSPVADMWRYDPVTNTWLQRASFGGGPRVECVSFSIGGLGYMGTGWDGVNFRKDFWEYNPDSSTVGVVDLQSIVSDLTVYPNPAHDFINCTLTNGEQGAAANSVSLYISDIQGKTLYTEQLQTTNHKPQTKIDISSFAKGNYLVVVTDGKEKRVKKFLKD